MKKITMWMIMMALAVSPFMAQEALPSVTEEQQIDQSIGEERQRVDREDMMVPGQESEEPVLEESVLEEPVLESEEIQFEEMEEQVTEPEEMEYEEPAYEEPAYEEPAYEEPAYEEPAYEEPAYEEPEYEEPEYEEPEYEEPEYEEADYEEADYEEMEEQEKPQRREVQTLMSGGGGYGAISLGYTEVNKLPALMMGVSAEWVIGHGFGLGFKGVGFTSDLTPVNDQFYALSGGYGGLVMEPIVMGWIPVHLAFPITIGGGGVASYSTSADLWTDDFDPYFGEYAVFFVAEAGVELEFNLVKFFRLALFGSYRWTTSLEMKPMYGLDPDPQYPVGNHALYGWSLGARFKFGSF